MKIKNKDLVHVINFLEGLNIKGIKSIHRTNIANKLKEKLEVFAEGQKQLQDEFKSDPRGFQDEIKKLVEQDNTIDDTDSKVEINSIKSVIKPLIENEETEFKDGDAIAVQVLYYALNLGGDR